jgi:hypothetical protein
LKKFWIDFQVGVFGQGSTYVLGLFRFVFGFLVLVNLAFIGQDFAEWYTERGYVPASMGAMWRGEDLFPGLFNGVTDPSLMAIGYGLICVVAIMAWLGLFTRVTVPLLAIGLISLHHRNPFFLHGGDTLMRCTISVLAFSRCGDFFSIDGWLKRRKNPDWEPAPASVWPQRLLQYQWALMYFTTAWGKAYGTLWAAGTAVWYPPRLTEFARFPVPEFVDSKPVVWLLTYGTLILEVALATLVFHKSYRKWVLIGGILLHLGIEWRLNIPLFAFLCISGYMNFYDGEEVRTWMENHRWGWIRNFALRTSKSGATP